MNKENSVPHLIYEYTSNLAEEGRIAELLRKSNHVLIDQGGAFPIGGIRSRAIGLADYCVADGTNRDDAFVHATLKVGAGRSMDTLKKAGDELFALMSDHFAPVLEKRYLALSLEIVEFSEAGTWKRNNIHSRYRKD